MTNSAYLFPYTKNEALAMLYVQTHLENETTPAQLLDLYNAALSEIEQRDKESIKG